jgi:hypothetical protein
MNWRTGFVLVALAFLIVACTDDCLSADKTPSPNVVNVYITIDSFELPTTPPQVNQPFNATLRVSIPPQAGGAKVVMTFDDPNLTCIAGCGITSNDPIRQLTLRLTQMPANKTRISYRVDVRPTNPGFDPGNGSKGAVYNAVIDGKIQLIPPLLQVLYTGQVLESDVYKVFPMGVRELTLRNPSASTLSFSQLRISTAVQISGIGFASPPDLSPLLPGQERILQIQCEIPESVSFFPHVLRITYSDTRYQWLWQLSFRCAGLPPSVAEPDAITTTSSTFPLDPLQNTDDDQPSGDDSVQRNQPLPPGDPGQGGTAFILGADSCTWNMGTGVTRAVAISTLSPGTPITATLNGIPAASATVNAGGAIVIEAATPFTTPSSITVTAGGVADSLSLACIPI